MKKSTRLEKLARGCFALTLSLAEWLELAEILSTSRRARSVFRQRARRRLSARRRAPRAYPNLFPALDVGPR